MQLMNTNFPHDSFIYRLYNTDVYIHIFYIIQYKYIPYYLIQMHIYNCINVFKSNLSTMHCFLVTKKKNLINKFTIIKTSETIALQTSL